MSEIRSSQSEDNPETTRPPWWLWPNLLGLDAAVIATVWLWAFATAYEAPVRIPHYLVLFLAVFCLYAADRFVDSRRVESGDASPGLQTRRHRFAARHSRWFLILMFFSALIGGLVGISQLERPVFGAGLIVLVGAIAYALTFVAPLGGKKPLPGKEIAGGFLFAAGTTLPVFADYSGTLPVIPSVSLFAGLCALNLLMIASREGDLPQGAAFGRFLTILGLILTLAAAGFALFGTDVETAPALRPLYFVQALGAAALTILQWQRHSASSEAYRVLADAVLLTPLIPAALLLG